MASNRVKRPVRLPQPDIHKTRIPLTTLASRSWFRVHLSRYNGIHFDLAPTHRFSHPDSPSKVIYLGTKPDTCFWECFGDLIFDGKKVLPKAKWDKYSISRIEVPSIKDCNLSEVTVRSALYIDMTAVHTDNISITQQWGLELQKHPDNITGFKFDSRFTNASCLVLFERSNLALQEKCLGPLNQFEAALEWLDKNQVALV
jgi:hypothetical protein